MEYRKTENTTVELLIRQKEEIDKRLPNLLQAIGVGNFSQDHTAAVCETGTTEGGFGNRPCESADADDEPE